VRASDVLVDLTITFAAEPPSEGGKDPEKVALINCVRSYKAIRNVWRVGSTARCDRVAKGEEKETFFTWLYQFNAYLKYELPRGELRNAGADTGVGNA